MQHIQMFNGINTPNDSAGEIVCLEQMVPEYLLCGIFKKIMSAGQYYSQYNLVLFLKAPLETLFHL